MIGIHSDARTRRRIVILLGLFVIFSAPVFAQAGAGAITEAANVIKSYWAPLRNLIQVVGGVVGLIGGLRIYNKWSNGDQDINKEVLGWGGACLFLILVPVFVGAFFNLGS